MLADEHQEFLKVVEGLLEPTFEVVEKVGDGEALVEAAEKLRPDVILTDISMPLLDGIQAVRKLHDRNLPSKIIFLTMHADSEIVRACMYAGATGYVLKSRINADLMPALHEVLKKLALRAGLNCGQCIRLDTLKSEPCRKHELCEQRKCKSCRYHPVCTLFSLHKFRRTFASMLMEAQTEVRTIQHLLGHSDISTTLPTLESLILAAPKYGCRSTTRSPSCPSVAGRFTRSVLI